MRNRRHADAVFFAVITSIIVILSGSGCLSRQNEPAALPITPPGEFIVAGSGPCLPLIRKLGEGFSGGKESTITVPPSIGSNGGISAVAEGAIDIGLSSRPLNAIEIARGLRQVPFARVGLVIGVNPDVPDSNITYQELVDIFLGKKDMWSSGRNIVVLNREPGDRTLSVLSAEVPGFAEALADSFKNRRWQICYTSAEEAKRIAGVGSSIGFTETAALTAERLNIKPLRVNGVEPTLQNVRNHSYPLYFDLYLVYKDTPSKRAQRFISFISSDSGQKIISANGGIPLKGK